MDGAGAPRLAVRLLGGVQATLGGLDLDLGPPGPRSLFAVLALRANTVVTRDELIDALWGEHPPRTADGNIYSYVSNLRKVVEPGRSGGSSHEVLVRSRGGYQLVVPPDRLDLARFATSAAAARTAMAAGDDATALAECGVALSLWRGKALGGAVGPLVEAERDRLDLRRLEVAELRCEALLATESAQAAVSELSALIFEHPLNERLHELQMLAMCRSGRQADALRVYRQVRERLADELSVDPGPALRRMHQRVLAGDPELTTASIPRRAAAQPRLRLVPAQPPHSVPVPAGRGAEVRRLRELCTTTPHTAHQQAPQFPDVQLVIDLRGVDPVADLGEMATLYRSLLSGRKVVIVVDNTARVEQCVRCSPGPAETGPRGTAS